MKRFFHALAGLVFFSAFLAGGSAYSQIAEKKQAFARRIQKPPQIDGDLNEAVWEQGFPATDFIQLKPYNGSPASHDSRVKFIYDDEAFYVGAFLMDPSPDSIYTDLTERDQKGMADYFGVYLDCYNDYLTAFGFFVTAAGVQIDLKSTMEDDDDSSWDGVWQSAVGMAENGWVVEFRIPYSALRFPKKAEHIWGLQLVRNITRYREESTWNYIDLEEDGQNNQAGELLGIENIDPPLRLSFVPYLSGYMEKSPETKAWGTSYNYGLDLKLGINESYTLDMTLVPDFGQVQSDDEIYNLSPFEVYFDERRPFFTEGTELFEKGNVFYTRRVGKTPGGFFSVDDSLQENEQVVDNPQHSQLVNATKISGKSSRKLAVGLFNAMTANTWATVNDTLSGTNRKLKTEPFTNYNMLVLNQALKNNSFISFYNTNTYQPTTSYSANVTGGEGKITSANNLWAIWGQGIVSQKYNAGTNPELGHRYSLGVGKISGNFTWELGHQAIDDKYDPNDMGFLRHNNVFSEFLELSYNIYKPTWHVLNWTNSIWFNYEQLYNPRTFTKFSIGFRSRTTLKNFLSVWLNGNITPVEEKNYWEPRVEGCYYTVPPMYRLSVGLSPDYRKRFLIDWRFGGYWASYRPEKGYNISGSPRYRANDKLLFILRSQYNFDQNNAGYVTDSLDTENHCVIIFGTRNIDTYENTLEANYRFTNKSSLALRLRHYWITLKYNGFYDLKADGTLSQTDYDKLHDFSYNIFNIDMQYIWNFAPGSEVRLVWKNAINTYEEQEVINSVIKPVEDNFGRNLSNLIQSPATNSFSVKLLYYIDYQQITKAFRKKAS